MFFGQDWWVITAWNDSPVYLFARIFWAVLAVTLHELAHGWTAIRCGDRTPQDSGHMTWNPVVHMGQSGLILFAITGWISGAMPIDPTRLRGRYDEAKVALAGPTANLTLFVIAMAIGAAEMRYGQSLDPEMRTNLRVFFFTGAWLNIALALFNMVPVPPLDGWRIVCAFSERFRRFWTEGSGPGLGMILFFVVFIFGGQFISPVASAAMRFMRDELLRVLP